MDNKASVAELVRNYSGRPLRIMEVCGTHTHEIFRLGIRDILPENITLISGPGCPVCVTPNSFIDEALLLALDRKATICTFGDLVRVPGSTMNLADARARGARVEVVYTPLDAETYAEEHPQEETVFLSVGFETTTPSSCMAVRTARKHGIGNFSLLTANKTMTNAYRLLKDSADAYLYPGHVCAITGYEICEELAEKEGISGAVTGFAADEILVAIAAIMEKCREGKPFVVNCYPRVVTREGNVNAKKIVEETMEPCDAIWRGIGNIPLSGLRLNGDYASMDARRKFSLPDVEGRENPACRCGEILRGNAKPYDCPLFGKACTPEKPVGSCMVSGEGSCSAYYKYGGTLWKKN